MAPHKSIAAGHRLLRSVVAFQIDCAFPLGLPVKGNSGEGCIALVASVIRLSQNRSSAFELACADLGFRSGGIVFSSSAAILATPSDGNSSSLVVGNCQR